MPETLVEPVGSHEPQLRKTPRKAAISAWIGSALEYYDFFIYGTAAALIFPKIFFPAGNAAAATIASLATFGVAYVARPIGSFVMGHLGDTIGRKAVLFITLFGMGLATFLIGVLPTYDQIGFAAPILLLVLRVCQGLAVSGEQSSASSTSLEHAPANRRAFFTSFTLAGTQGGNILATAVRTARTATAVLGLAHPVPAQRGRRVRRLVDPAHPAREPGLCRGAAARRRAHRAAQGAVPQLHP